MNTSALKMYKLISLPFARRLAVFPHGRSVGRYGHLWRVSGSVGTHGGPASAHGPQPGVAPLLLGWPLPPALSLRAP